VNSSGAQFDEEQHIQPFEPHGVDGEEVAGDDPSGLLAQERAPGGGRSPRRRVQSVAAQRRADRGRRNSNTKAQQLALDPLIAPARVLAGQANDQLLQLMVEWRLACSAVRVGPRARDEAAVPAQQRLGLDEEARPAGARQCPAECREQGAVGGLEPGPRDLAAQHGELWWSTRMSRSLAASPRASRTSSWIERQSAR
jgi:hypothetical protein